MENPKKLQKELKQVKYLLAELRKAKLKCLELCEHLGKDLPRLQSYEILEVRCTRTAENLDRAAIIDLQEELAKSLAELYEVERNLMHQAEKNSFKKMAAAPLPGRQRTYDSKRQIGPFNVPTYFTKPEPGDKKIERIANFIDTIGKSMDSLRKSMQSQQQWKLKDFLAYEPEYLNVKRRIQQFRMRDQQIVQALQKKVKQEISRFISQGEKVQEGKDYYVMKVSKKKIDNYDKSQDYYPRQRRHDRSLQAFDSSYHPVSIIEPKRAISISKKKALQRIYQEGVCEPKSCDKINQPSNEADQLDLHITSFQKSNRQIQSRVSKLADNSQMDYDENGNFVYMVKKVSPDSQINSSIISSISSLRSLRKKVFDDDIWDQFQKL